MVPNDPLTQSGAPLWMRALAAVAVIVAGWFASGKVESEPPEIVDESERYPQCEFLDWDWPAR